MKRRRLQKRARRRANRRRQKSRGRGHSIFVSAGLGANYPAASGGSEHALTLLGEPIRRVPRARPMRRFAIVFAGLTAAVLGAARLFALDSDQTWALALLGGRILAVTLGPLALLAVLLYYYSAGINRPLDEAGRIMVGMAGIGLVLLAVVAVFGHFEGWLGDGLIRLLIIAGAVGAFGAMGVVLAQKA